MWVIHHITGMYQTGFSSLGDALRSISVAWPDSCWKDDSDKADPLLSNRFYVWADPHSALDGTYNHIAFVFFTPLPKDTPACIVRANASLHKIPR